MIENAVRGIGAFIDRAIYSIVEVIMQLIIDLSNLQIFSESSINTFARRIYVILGLVMLFKIMISFIQILINPEKMDDKEQGVGGVLKRVVISLALIYLVPSIFDLARQVQNQVLPIIPRVILGVEISPDPEDETSQEAMSSVGRMMAFYSFLPFFNYDNPNCNDGSILGTGPEENATIWSVGTALEAREATCSDSTSDGQYKYKYSWPLSSLVGAFLIYVLVTVAVAIAIRAIKLGICEFIAPIPIASYIDPKTSGKAFNSWVSTSVKTYLDLFIRLGTVYFTIFIFMTFLDSDNLTAIYSNLGGDFWRGALVTLFVIVALLQFAKQAPKFISDMLGLAEGTMLKDMFTGQGWKQIASGVGGVAGMAAAPVSSMISNYNYSKKVRREKGALPFLRSLGGLGSGIAKSTASAFNGGGWSGAMSARDKVTATSRHRANLAYTRRNARENYNSGMSEYNRAQANLSSLRSQVASKTSDLNAAAAQGKASWDQYIAAKQSGNTRMANVHRANYENQVAKQKRIQKDIDTLNSQIDMASKIERPVRSPAYGLGRAQTAVSHFTGMPLPSSDSYSSASSLMMKGKGIFNEAKSKVTEAPTLINDTITFKNKSGTTFGSGTFSQIYSALNEAKATGREVNLNGQNLSAGQLEDIYGEALKKTAETYVNRVKSNGISNDTMLTDIQMFEESMREDLILEKGDNEALSAYDKNNPGAFLKSADTLGKNFEQKAAQYKRNELPKE